MPTKQKVTSEQPKETTKTSREKYKEKKKTGKSKTASQKKTRTKRGGSPVSKKGSPPNTKRRSKEIAKFGESSNPNSIEDAQGRTRKEQKKLQKAEKIANKRPIRRIFPIWLRLIVIPLLCAAALLLGLMFGYGILGDGNPKDALNMDTWQHIVDIVRKK